MASPQCEEGYVRISNELLEQAYKRKLTDSAWRVWLAIIRLCYGFNKCQAQISISRLERETGMSRRVVITALYLLERFKMITVNREEYTNVIRVQKDYELWEDSVPDYTKTSVAEDTSVVEDTSVADYTKTSVADYTPYNIEVKTKDTLFVEDSVEFRLSDLLRQEILANNPRAKVPSNGQIQGWCKTFDLMIRRDGRSPEEIEDVIHWCQADDFWRTNILSPDKLRKQFDQLVLKMQKAPSKCLNADAYSYACLSELERCGCKKCLAVIDGRAT